MAEADKVALNPRFERLNLVGRRWAIEVRGRHRRSRVLHPGERDLRHGLARIALRPVEHLPGPCNIELSAWLTAGAASNVAEASVRVAMAA